MVNCPQKSSQLCDIVGSLPFRYCPRSADMPSLLVMCPRNLILDCSNEHFSRLSAAPSSSICLSVSFSLLSCSSVILPKTMTPAIWHKTPSSPFSIVFMRFNKSSGALEMPKGSLLNQYHPNGVIKVVSGRDSSLSFL